MKKVAARVTVPLTPVQKRYVQRVYDMARYASRSTDYGEHDQETGDYLGVDPKVEHELEFVRQLFKLSGEEDT